MGVWLRKAYGFEGGVAAGGNPGVWGKPRRCAGVAAPAKPRPAPNAVMGGGAGKGWAPQAAAADAAAVGQPGVPAGTDPAPAWRNPGAAAPAAATPGAVAPKPGFVKKAIFTRCLTD